MRSTRRSIRIAAVAASASLLLAACGDNGDTDDDMNGDMDAQTDMDDDMDGDMDADMDDDMNGMDDDADMDAEGASLPTDEFGPACGAIPEDGPGSSEGMAEEPAATAASNNPVLSTLVDLVVQADLVDAINDLDGATIFAPSNDAFDELAADDPETFEAVAGDNDLLTTVLTNHVIADEELDAPGLEEAGTATTLAEQELTFTVDGETVNVEAAGADADVVCGNVATANATVHIIDYVLVPDVG